ncbi:IclR family transcriptional regulator [Bacillus massiliigorillae]|uniref:IclR family transcriptional regulator n=1 Tax=Bacillus massiliigorillae TaxID=1243664 RepID=UPI0003A69885|nr:IclR family transcriptional regulator [Bacillus massiliigorillae]
MSSKQATHRLSTVDNAMSLLALFLKYDSVGLIDIERETGVSKTAAFRLAATMVDRGFLVKDAKTKKYYPGPILFQLVHKFQVNDIITISEPFVQELANMTNESVYISIRSGNNYFFLSGVHSTYPVKVTSPFGDEVELYLGAAGKVHMAHMASVDIDNYLKKTQFKTFTPDTITDEQLILKELEEVKEKGYAVSLGEGFPDSSAISAPIWGLGEEPTAVLNILLPSTRLTTEKQQEFIELIKNYSEKISNEYMLKKDSETIYEQ